MLRILLAAALLCVVGPALADTAPAVISTWSPGPLWLILSPFVTSIFNVVVLPVLLGWLCWILKSKFNLDVSNSAKADLQQSAANAAGRVMARADAKFSTMQIDVGSPLIAKELPALQTAAAASIKALDLSPDRVANLLLGKVGQLQMTAPAPVVAVVPAADAALVAK